MQHYQAARGGVREVGKKKRSGAIKGEVKEVKRKLSDWEKRTRGREQRERELGTLSDAALPKGTVIKRKTGRGIQ